MALLSDYTAGTISVADGATAVTGVGTAWLASEFQEGDLLFANGYSGVVLSVESNTALTLAQPWRGGDLIAAAYRLRYQSDGSRYSAQARKLIELFYGDGNVQALADIDASQGEIPVFTGPGSMSTISPENIRLPLKVSDFSPSKPMFAPHRGSSQLYPEHTRGAYEASLRDGANIIEIDCWKLSDGSAAIFHDSTVNRVTSGTGNLTSLNAASFKALYVDGENWHGANVPGMHETLLFDEALDMLKGKVAVLVEAKNAGAGALIVDRLLAHGISPDHAIVAAFDQAELAAALAAGYPTQILSESGTAKLSSAQAAGVTWAGLGNGTTNVDIATWKAAGFKVMIWTVNRRWRRDELIGLAVDGFCTDDLPYLRTNKPIATADKFFRKAWMPGMLAMDETLGSSSRGRFFGRGFWGWADVDTSVDSRAFVLQGWASPVGGKDANSSWSMTFRARYGKRLANAGWMSVLIADEACKDRPFHDNSALDAGMSGYNILFRADGRIAIYRVDNGVAVQLAQTTIAEAPSMTPDRGEGVFRITVTATAIRGARLNADGSEMVAIEAADALYRGGYIHFGRSGICVGIRDVQISDGPTTLPFGWTENRIVERGTNANGEYVRFDDGTMFCLSSLINVNINVAAGSVFWTNAVTATMPSAFASQPVGGGALVNTINGWVNPRCDTSSWIFSAFSQTSRGANVDTVKLSASGRWF